MLLDTGSIIVNLGHKIKFHSTRPIYLHLTYGIGFDKRLKLRESFLLSSEAEALVVRRSEVLLHSSWFYLRHVTILLTKPRPLSTMYVYKWAPFRSSGVQLSWLGLGMCVHCLKERMPDRVNYSTTANYN